MKEKRAIVIYGGALKTLREELEKLIGEDMSSAVLFRYGFRCGRLTARELDMHPDIKGGAHLVADMCTEAGIAELTPVRISENEVLFNLENIIDEYEGGDFTRGYIAGALSEFLGKNFYGTKEGKMCLVTESERLYQKKDKSGDGRSM